MVVDHDLHRYNILNPLAKKRQPTGYALWAPGGSLDTYLKIMVDQYNRDKILLPI